MNFGFGKRSGLLFLLLLFFSAASADLEAQALPLPQIPGLPLVQYDEEGVLFGDGVYVPFPDGPHCVKGTPGISYSQVIRWPCIHIIATVTVVIENKETEQVSSVSRSILVRTLCFWPGGDPDIGGGGEGGEGGEGG